MKIIQGHANINELRAESLPTPCEVRNAFPQYTRGYIGAMYNISKQKWAYSYFETRDEAIQYFEEFKNLVYACNGALGQWIEYGDYVVYAADSMYDPHWSARFMVVDE